MTNKMQYQLRIVHSLFTGPKCF